MNLIKSVSDFSNVFQQQPLKKLFLTNRNSSVIGYNKVIINSTNIINQFNQIQNEINSNTETNFIIEKFLLNYDNDARDIYDSSIVYYNDIVNTINNSFEALNKNKLSN